MHLTFCHAVSATRRYIWNYSGGLAMARWIAFDQDTAAELRSQLPRNSVFDAPGRDALEYALNTSRPVVALMGPAGDDEVTIAIFRATRVEAAPPPMQIIVPIETPPVRESSHIRASGFLGLSDDFVGADEEENAEKRAWWQFWR
jgi:hypothetical protein